MNGVNINKAGKGGWVNHLSWEYQPTLSLGHLPIVWRTVVAGRASSPEHLVDPRHLSRSKGCVFVRSRGCVGKG